MAADCAISSFCVFALSEVVLYRLSHQVKTQQTNGQTQMILPANTKNSKMLFSSLHLLKFYLAYFVSKGEITKNQARFHYFLFKVTKTRNGRNQALYYFTCVFTQQTKGTDTKYFYLWTSKLQRCNFCLFTFHYFCLAYFVLLCFHPR